MLLCELSGKNKILTNRKHCKLSYLVEGDYNDLKTFKWDDIVELWQEFPLLAKALVSFVIPSSMEVRHRKLAAPNLVPKIGTIYGILAQARQDRLSKVQKRGNILLHDNICDQKVSILLAHLSKSLGWDVVITLCPSAIVNNYFVNTCTLIKNPIIWYDMMRSQFRPTLDGTCPSHV